MFNQTRGRVMMRAERLKKGRRWPMGRVSRVVSRLDQGNKEVKEARRWVVMSKKVTKGKAEGEGRKKTLRCTLQAVDGICKYFTRLKEKRPDGQKKTKDESQRRNGHIIIIEARGGRLGNLRAIILPWL